MEESGEYAGRMVPIVCKRRQTPKYVPRSFSTEMSV
jgi:hypothetical protein